MNFVDKNLIPATVFSDEIQKSPSLYAKQWCNNIKVNLRANRVRGKFFPAFFLRCGIWSWKQLRRIWFAFVCRLSVNIKAWMKLHQHIPLALVTRFPSHVILHMSWTSTIFTLKCERAFRAIINFKVLSHVWHIMSFHAADNRHL